MFYNLKPTFYTDRGIELYVPCVAHKTRIKKLFQEKGYNVKVEQHVIHNVDGFARGTSAIVYLQSIYDYTRFCEKHVNWLNNLKFVNRF